MNLSGIKSNVFWNVVCLVLGCQLIHAQGFKLTGTVVESGNHLPIGYLNVAIHSVETRYAVTNHAGQFVFEHTPAGKYSLDISMIGFESVQNLIDLKADMTLEISLKPVSINLKEVTIQAPVNLKQNTSFVELDRELRPVNTAQDLLQIVPGLFLAQHAGGGKAEQIFLRGFDNDHGTDFFISVDGLPVNMVSHAHGQGYADFHFVIPETIDKLAVFKGPYMAKFGDFSTGGTGEFTTKATIQQSMIKLEAGQFNSGRIMGMFNLLGPQAKNNQHLYVAGEYVHTDSYFDKKQNFNRYNLFAKYQIQLSNNTFLQTTASHFNASWTGSGQIPERAVAAGIISRFGQLDSSEGGRTSRTNLNAIITTSLTDHALLKNQFYYTRYDFSLFSDFTFFLRDPVRGDEIHQIDHRNIIGYNGSYLKDMTLFSLPLTTTLGIGSRMDFTQVALNYSQRRYDFQKVVEGKVHQFNTSAYIDFDLHLTDRWMLNAGSRLDHFIFNFDDQLAEQKSAKSIARISPKLNFFYQLNPNVRFFAKSGIGFHSNDARAVVLGRSENSLPKMVGYETGSEFKIGNSLLMNVALWALHAQSELVYIGDEGVVETNYPTNRMGLDIGLRYQVLKKVFADLDLNYNHGRLDGAQIGENFIPLAPTFTSSGGVQYKQPKGFNAAIHYRYMDSRPANEDNSVKTKQYTVWDLSVVNKLQKVDYGFTIENIFNTAWNQAQFDTMSRLKNESSPVEELHFTPGTPFFFKANICYKF